MKRMAFLQLFLLIGLFSGAQTEANQIQSIQKKRELAAYEILVWPNPSTDRVFIDAPPGARCEVFSAQGTYVGTWEAEEGGIRLDDLGSGTYLAVIRCEGETVHRRFVVL